MKKLFMLSFCVSTFCFGNYSVYFNGIKLGDIKNFDTLKENYLKGSVTNGLANFLLGKDFFVYYNEDYKGITNDKNTKYKKDKYGIIYILKKAYSNNLKAEKIQIKEDKYIDIYLDENFKFEYNSKGEIKSIGYFKMSNGELEELKETINSISIEKE